MFSWQYSISKLLMTHFVLNTFNFVLSIIFTNHETEMQIIIIVKFKLKIT